MTVFKSITIACDWPGCPGNFDRGHLILTKARETAAAEDWKNFNGLIDLCGPADQAPEWLVERSRMQGHAGAEHQPKLTAITAQGENRVQVGCACGWADPSPWPAPRHLARSRWANHVQEATAEQPAGAIGSSPSSS